jgi:ADP-heptose:LPS heptosyltransferase
LVVSTAARIGVLAVTGHRQEAADYTRHLGIYVHDDLLSLVTKLQGVIGPRWRADRPVDTILVVKLDRIGDLVNTTPVFDVLRARFPTARIDVVGHPVPLTLFEADSRIDGRFPYRSCLYHPLSILPPTLSEIRLVWQLLTRRYSLVVYLRGSFPFLLLGLVSPLAAAKFLQAEPVTERYLKPIKALIGPVASPRPSLRVGRDAYAKAERFFSKGTIAGRRPRVAIHATASLETKQWPADRFAKVADELRASLDAEVHFYGSGADRERLERILSLATHSHSIHVGAPLHEVVAAIAASDVFIGNDSGLGHVAAAVGTASVLIWGPANLNMARPVAAPGKCVILYHDVTCRHTCDEVRCHNPVYMECLVATGTDAVVEAANGLLRACTAV